MKELAADGIPVAVTCRVLKLAHQPYYRWLAEPVTDGEIVEAYLANALSDADREDPEFGYRYLVEEAHDVGEPMAEHTAWRICSQIDCGACSARSAASRARRSATIWSSVTSPLKRQINWAQ